MIDGLTLKQARMLRGMTQRQLANALNKSESTIVKWESGKTEPRVSEFSDLCDVLNVDKNNIILPIEQE